MSKYLDDLTKQLKGKDINHFTKEIQASNNLSKIMRDRHDKKIQSEVKKDIQRLLRR